MEKSTKRKIAVAGSVLGMVGGLAGILAGVSDGSGAGRNAAAPPGSVRAQRVDDTSTNAPTPTDGSSPAPTGNNVPAPADNAPAPGFSTGPNGTSFTGHVTVMVRNKGAFVAGACVRPNGTEKDQVCSGNINVNKTWTKGVDLTNQSTVNVFGFARDGKLGGDMLTSADVAALKPGQDTYCFRFNGTDGKGLGVIPGFLFKHVECSDLDNDSDY